MSRVLVIGDIHEPISRKHYLRFCRDTHRQYRCNKVVFIGDIVDWTAISMHAFNPEAPGPMDEFALALSRVQQWYKAFPKATVCIGNHDARPRRVAESVNIPKSLLRDFADLWKTPKWKWVYSAIIDNVFYHHGHKKSGGINPAYNTSKNMGMSVVLGHNHSRGGVKWSVSPIQRWFGMDVGCGIDDRAYAFAYASEQTARSVISCGVVINGVPQHIMMPIGKGEKYYDEKERMK
jgi:metallophosphoesterase superfamily enzyme